MALNLVNNESFDFAEDRRNIIYLSVPRQISSSAQDWVSHTFDIDSTYRLKNGVLVDSDLNSLTNPALVSAGFYILDNQTDSTEGKPCYYGCCGVQFYDHGGYYNTEAKGAYKVLNVIQPFAPYTGITLTAGKWLVYKFIVADGE